MRQQDNCRLPPAVYKHSILFNIQKSNGGSISFINYKHELRRNTMLSSNLVELEKAAVHTRQIQYLLYAIISCLLIVIIAGLLAWQRHQRRLRQLYEVLMEQHTIWLQAHETEDILPPAYYPYPLNRPRRKVMNRKHRKYLL